MKNPRILNFHSNRIWQETAYLVFVHRYYVPVFFDHRRCWVNHQPLPMNGTKPGFTYANGNKALAVQTLARLPKAEWFRTMDEAVAKYPDAMLIRDTTLDIS